MMSHREGVEVSSEEYEKSKLSFIEAISGSNSPMRRPEVRQRLVEGAKKRDKSTYKGISRPGNLNPNYNNHKLAGNNHPLYDTHRSEDVKQKISKTRLERHCGVGKDNPRARKVLCVETGIIYDTGLDASKSVSGSKSGICRACKLGVEYKSFH